MVASAADPNSPLINPADMAPGPPGSVQDPSTTAFPISQPPPMGLPGDPNEAGALDFNGGATGAMDQALAYDPSAKFGESLRKEIAGLKGLPDEAALTGTDLLADNQNAGASYHSRAGMALLEQERALQRMRAGGNAATDATQGLAGASQQANDREAQIRAAVVKADEKHALAARKNLATHNKIQTQMESLFEQTQQLDKDAAGMFTEPSFMKTVGVSIARGLGAGIQHLTGSKENPIGSQIDADVAREKQRQMFILSQKREGIANKSLLLGRLEQTLGDKDKALAAYDVLVGQAVENKLKMFAGSSQDPRVKAQLAQALAEQQQKNAQAEATLHGAMAKELLTAEGREQARATAAAKIKLAALADRDKRSIAGWTKPAKDPADRRKLEDIGAATADVNANLNKMVQALSSGKAVDPETWINLQSGLATALLRSGAAYGLSSKASKMLIEKEEKALTGVSSHGADVHATVGNFLMGHVSTNLETPSPLFALAVAKPDLLIRRLKDSIAEKESGYLRRAKAMDVGLPTEDNIVLGRHLRPQDAQQDMQP